MTETFSENETTGANPAAETIYALAAAPGVTPGASGAVFAAHGAGLLRSTDGGRAWSDALAALNLSEPVPVTSLALSPVYAREPRVVAGAPGGVFLSSDGGETWRAVVMASPAPTVTALAVSPNFAEDETIFAGTMEDGVFLSRSGGESWVGWNFGLLDLNVMCLAVSPNFAEDETVLAGTETGIFRSTNGGRAWREVELPFGFDPVLSLAFTPRGMYAGTENQGLWRSADGETWQPVAPETITDPVNALLPAGDGLLLLAGSAVWQSADGETWQERPLSTPEGAEITALALGPGGALLAGFDTGQVQWME